MKRILSYCVLILVCFLAARLDTSAANIVIQAGAGFNDPTPTTPVGGNNGTTLGQQRLNAFQAAANIWGASLTSNQTIIVAADWQALTCTSSGAVLGSAGAATNTHDFPGAPFAGTWYPIALVNKIADADLRPALADINATFNVNLGNAGCLDGHPFYLGLDNNHGSNPDLVTVLLHELGHGLGFLTLTDENTGAFASGFPTIFDRFLMGSVSGKSWLSMTNARGSTSATSLNQLVWNGPQVVNDATFLTSGRDAFTKPQMYAPNPTESGSSVSHWARLASPNLLMEPVISSDLTHSVTPTADLSFSQMSDIGWVPSSLPSSIRTTTGDGQRAGINIAFSTPITVTIAPAISNLQVTWTVVGNGTATGTFPSTSSRTAVSTTNASGIAQAPPLTPTGGRGPLTLVATVPGAGSTTFTLNAQRPL